MSLGRSTPTTMDLAAIGLGDVVQIRPGVFCHPDSLAGRLARLFGRWTPMPAEPPAIPAQLAARRRAAAKTKAPRK